MARVTMRIDVRIDHKRLAKMVKKATAKIEATPEENRIEAFCEWASKIANECITLELDGDVLNLPKDS